MAINIGPRIGIAGEAEYRKQIQNIIQQTKTLKSEYDKVTAAGDKNSTSLKKNAEQHKILSQQIEVQEQRVKELASMVEQSSQKYGEADTKTLKWKEALYSAETELSNLQAKLKELPSNLDLVGQKMQDMGDKIKGVGQGMTNLGQTFAPVSAAAAAGLVGSAKAAIGFESAMTGVKKTVEGTEAEYEELSDWIKNASTKMASSKADIAAVMETAGQLGVSGVENLEDFTKTMVMLGDTTDLSSDEAASALAKFMNITRTSLKDSDKLGSSIVDLGNNFATTESDIVEMSTRLASAGTIAGLSATDILALSASMSSVGIEAEAGGTAMSQTLKKIVTAVDSGGTTLETFARVSGLSAEDFANQWKSSPIEALQAFIAGLGNLNEEDESVIALLDELGMSGIRQSNMLQALSLSSGMLADAVSTSNQAFTNNNALMEEAEKRYGTTASKMEQAKEKLSNIGIEIGERLLPYANRGLDLLDQAVAAWDGLSTEEQDTIVKTAALTALIAPLLITGGKVVSGIGSLVSGGGKLLSFIGQLTPALGTASGALSATGSTAAAAGAGIAGIAAPVAVAVGALALLGGAFVTAYKNDEEFASEVDKSWAEIKQSITDVINTVKPLWDEFSATLAPVFVAGLHMINSEIQNFKDYLQGFINFVAGIFSGDWKRALSGAKQMTAGTVNHIISRFEFMRDSIAGIFKRANFEFPKIKLPHIRVSGEWSLNPPSAPSFAVDWYSKAMANGIRLTSPTIFGAMGNKLLGGGEAGPEWIVGENSLMGMIHSAVRGGHGDVSIGDTTIIINAEGQDAEEIADRVDEIITMRLQQAEAAWA